jgi:phosphoenolpyruvate carboxykinase (GTP)
VKSPIGFVPAAGAVDLSGLSVSKDDLQRLLSVDRQEWLAEVESQSEFFAKLGSHLPKEITDEQAALHKRLKD